jgi:hypothetical protein
MWNWMVRWGARQPYWSIFYGLFLIGLGILELAASAAIHYGSEIERAVGVASIAIGAFAFACGIAFRLNRRSAGPS